MKHFTYAHYTEDTNELFYIGKGISRRYKDRSGRNPFWKNKVAKHGFRYEILAYWDTEKEALEHEVLLIAAFREMGFRLCNITDGGEGTKGVKHTEEAKRRMSEYRRGRSIHPPEARKRISERMKGNKHTLGHKLSPERIEQISLLHKGKPKTETHRRNLSQARQGLEVPCIWVPIRCDTTGIVYPSLKDAAKDTGADPSHIVKCCRGKLKTTKKLEFSYVPVD